MKRAFAALILCAVLLFTAGPAAANWKGVDETVVNKFAEEHGRSARDPYINTDKGDLLLFMFLIAGLVGGFAGGHYWRVLTENKSSEGAKNTKEGPG